MSTFMRLSAAAVTIIAISAVLGFELGVAAVSNYAAENILFSDAPVVASPGAGSQRNMKTRSVAGLESAFGNFPKLASTSYPMPNPIGPKAADTRVKIKMTRSIAPLCQMAMN